jgi:hypothetical protein
MDLRGDAPTSGQVAHDSDSTISQAQAKRIYAISGGNADICKSVLQAYGYERSENIKKVDYEKICAEVEARAKGS